MKKNHGYKLAVIGGDARQLIAASALKAAGHDVMLYGFSEKDTSDDISDTTADRGTVVDSLCCSSSSVRPHELLHNLADGTVSDCGVVCATIPDALFECDAVILPLPMSGDGIHVSMPLAPDCRLTLGELCEMMLENGVKLLCGGKLSQSLTSFCKLRGIALFDYYESDAFSIANAVPTAEGAIEIAMRETPTTLDGSSALVIGYGRIGKVLARLLTALGVKVTASARKAADLAWIRAGGHIAVETCKLSKILSEQKFDMIFNTVPYTVLGEEALRAIGKRTLIIDLASKPGGVDIKAADKMGVGIIWALSLPGKVAPVTSGRIIADTILGYLEKIAEGE